jgi:hypothetical protein
MNVVLEGAVDGAHAAFAKLGDDAIVGDGGMWTHRAKLYGMVLPSVQLEAQAQHHTRGRERVAARTRK